MCFMVTSILSYQGMQHLLSTVQGMKVELTLFQKLAGYKED